MQYLKSSFSLTGSSSFIALSSKWSIRRRLVLSSSVGSFAFTFAPRSYSRAFVFCTLISVPSNFSILDLHSGRFG